MLNQFKCVGSVTGMDDSHPLAPTAAPLLASVPAARPSAPRRPRRSGEETRRHVVAAAREQIEQAGIITLNVAAVARACDISETLVYRHFASRAGLLEEALVQMWDDHAAHARADVEALLAEVVTEQVSPGRIAKLLPTLGGTDRARQRLLRIQILAASATLPTLRARIAATQRSHDAAIEHAAATALRDVAPELRVSAVRAIRALVVGVSLGLGLADLNPEHAPSDTDLHALWADLLEGLASVASVRPGDAVSAA